MRKLVILLSMVYIATWFTAAADEPRKTSIKVLEVKFEPVARGKNVVNIKVHNGTGLDQVFGIHIQTRSPKYLRHGRGWGTVFFRTLGAYETKWVRFVFKIRGPITDRTWVRLRFYNPESKAQYDYKGYFGERKYRSRDMERRDVGKLSAPISGARADIVMKTFRDLQRYIREKRYEDAWAMFTKDYQEAKFQTNFERFTQAMNRSSPTYALFWWSRKDFLKLEPESVYLKNGRLVLKAKQGKQVWRIYFVSMGDEWKIDWIGGYVLQEGR